MKLLSYPLLSLMVRLSLASLICPVLGLKPAGSGGRQMLCKLPASVSCMPLWREAGIA